jgi:hypothetical protein
MGRCENGPIILPYSISLYESANILIDGFTYGFKINYTGPRTPVVCKKFKSIYKYPDIALQKIQSEIEFGRIMGLS